MPFTVRFTLLTVLIGLGALAPISAQAQGSTGQLPIEVIPNIPSNAQSIALSPDESLMATGQYDGVIKLVDVATGRLLRTFQRHSKAVNDVMFVGGGKQMLSASDDMTIKLWDITTGRLIRTTELKTSIQYFWSIKLSPDGTRALTSTTPNGKYTAEVKLWDVATGRVLRTFQANALRVVFSPDGTRVLAGGGGINHKPGGQVTLWDAASGRQLRTFEGHKAFSSVDRIAISPDGRLAVSSAGIDKETRLWDLASGRTLRTLFHEKPIYLLSFASDGKRVFTCDEDGALREWSVATGQLLRTIQKDGGVSVMSYMRDGARVLTMSGDGLQLWELATTKTLHTFRSELYFLYSAVFSREGDSMVSGGKSFRHWDAKTGQLIAASAPTAIDANNILFAPAANRALWRSSDLQTLTLTDMAGGPVLASFQHTKQTSSVALSSDGSRVLASAENTMMLWDTAGAKLLRTFTHPDVGPAGFKSADTVASVAISPDNARVLSGNSFGTIRLWDAASGRLIWTYTEGPGVKIVWSLEFSPDGSRVLATISDRPKLLDAAAGRLLHPFDGHQSGFITTVAAFSSDGSRMLSSSHDLTTKLWDVATGRLLRSMETGTVHTPAFSPDGRRALLNGVVWDLETGERLVSILSSGDDEWLVITPEGYFAASAKGASVLSVVRGLESWSIDQFYQSLYRPDLVREKLAGDTRGLVREAAAKLDLTKVLASGNAPIVTLASPRDGTRATGEQVTAEVEIAERGGGIGRVEWRINGVTVGIETPPAPAAGQPLRLTRGLVLDDGENEIEVVAYNGANLVASVPARASVTGQAAATAGAPARMFVLAVGLNEYAEAKFKLAYAVPDAKALARALSEAGKGVYESVEVTLVQDAEVQRGKLDAVFAELAAKVRPSDVFVFFLGGHGKTIDGRYYFIPQDFRVEGGVTKAALDAAVVKQGIAQEEWQAWLARIPARKSVLLFDTCESGSLTGEGKETRALERGAANDRLVQATGRTILTASSDDTDAFEGFRGHGLFTYNVLEALERADSDGNGRIEVAELAAYVYAQVTALSEQVYKQRQVPQVRITGNYSLAKPTQIFAGTEPGIVLPGKATHQVTSAAELLVLPAMGARRVRRLDAKTPVTLVKSDAGWTLVAREGRPLGFVATKDLAPIQ